MFQRGDSGSRDKKQFVGVKMKYHFFFSQGLSERRKLEVERVKKNAPTDPNVTKDNRGGRDESNEKMNVHQTLQGITIIVFRFCF